MKEKCESDYQGWGAGAGCFCLLGAGAGWENKPGAGAGVAPKKTGDGAAKNMPLLEDIKHKEIVHLLLFFRKNSKFLW